MSNYDERKALLKRLERMTQARRQVQEEQERLQRAAWAHQQWLLLQQQTQYHLHHQLPFVNQPKSSVPPSLGLGPPSFLEFDNSFLTPWQRQGRGDDRDSALPGSYFYDLETGVPRMQLQPGSFFEFEPFNLIEQIRAQRSTESSKDKQEEDDVKREAVRKPEGMKITTAKSQIDQVVKNAPGQGKGKEKNRDGGKKKSLDKEGNNNLEEEEKDEIVDVASTSDNVDSQAMRYIYQSDRRRYKKTYSRKPGKS